MIGKPSFSDPRGIGDRIGELLELRKLPNGKRMSQAKLAEEVGVTEKTINHWLKGRRIPNMGKLEKLANALGTTVTYLLTGKEDVKSPPAEEIQNEDDFIDQVLSVRYRGDLSDEGVVRMTTELLKSLSRERNWSRANEPNDESRD